jgi:hypothetical protein
MTAQRYVLGCGTPVIVDFDSGERLVTCPGGGIDPGSPIDKPTICPGRERHCVRAEPVSTVVYSSRRLP